MVINPDFLTAENASCPRSAGDAHYENEARLNGYLTAFSLVLH